MELTPLADGAPAALATADTGPAACPVDHVALAAAAQAEAQAADTGPAACPVDHVALAAAATARCPVPHVAAAASGCPVPHKRGPVRHTKADLFVRRLLRIKERPAGVSAATAYQAFQKSMLISATRCTLTYVIFPFVLPAIGYAAQGAVGVTVGVGAMVADVFTIRRFFAVDHKWRWYFSGIVFGIMCLLTALLVQDISHLLR